MARKYGDDFLAGLCTGCESDAAFRLVQPLGNRRKKRLVRRAIFRDGADAQFKCAAVRCIHDAVDCVPATLRRQTDAEQDDATFAGSCEVPRAGRGGAIGRGQNLGTANGWNGDAINQVLHEQAGEQQDHRRDVEAAHVRKRAPDGAQ